MNDKRLWLAAVACLLALSAANLHALSLIAPPPPGLRVAPADLVVVGKATKFDDKLVKGQMFDNDNRDMKIATFEVSDTIAGSKAKEIKVGFFPPMKQGGGGGKPLLIGGQVPTVQLVQDEEMCLFLVKHPKLADVYVPLSYWDGIAKKGNDNYAKQIEEVKKAAKLLVKPMDGLKSKDADERFATAALLITRYRNRRQGAQKTEEIPAAESKLILEALAGADWAQKATPGSGGQGAPTHLFAILQVTEKDGWKQPKDFSKYAEEAKKWCKDNAGKYRITRFTSEEKSEKK